MYKLGKYLDAFFIFIFIRKLSKDCKEWRRKFNSNFGSIGRRRSLRSDNFRGSFKKRQRTIRGDSGGWFSRFGHCFGQVRIKGVFKEYNIFELRFSERLIREMVFGFESAG